jgi:hypothetical protein
MTKWAILLMILTLTGLAVAQDKSIIVDHDEAVVSGAWSHTKNDGGLDAVRIHCQRRAALCVEVRMWDSRAANGGKIIDSTSDALHVISWTSTTIVAEEAGSCHYLARTLVIHFVEGAVDGNGSVTETMDNPATAAKGRACKEKPDPLMPQTWVLESQVPEGTR